MVKGSDKNWVILRLSCAIVLAWIFTIGFAAIKNNSEYQKALDSQVAGQLVRSWLCACASK